MHEDPSFIQQVQHLWQAMAASVSASIGGAWAMIRAHSKRIERVEQKADTLEETKATRTELKSAIDRVNIQTERIYHRIDDLYMILLSKADERTAKQIRDQRD